MPELGHIHHLATASTAVRDRYMYADALAPRILALHRNFTRIVFFGGVAVGRAREDSDVDIGALYLLEPYDYSIHREMLSAFRICKASIGQGVPFPVHLVILDENDVQAGQSSLFQNIRDQGITLCAR